MMVSIMKYLAPVVGLCLLAADSARCQPRQVEDLRCPGPGISRIRLEQFHDDRTYRPTFAGDVDADGFEDFLLLQTYDSGGSTRRRTVLVYGQAAYPPESLLEDLRTTIFLHEPRGILTVLGSLTPFAAAGDVDGDGMADFFMGSPGTDWNGIPLAGQALLVFGSDQYGPEVLLGSPPSPGVRIKRFISNRDGLALGWVIAPAGDLNGDSFQDIAISTRSGIGSVNGMDDAGMLHVIFGEPTSSSEEDVLLEDLGISVDGFVLEGAYGYDEGHNNGDSLGYALAGVGDVNGDGLDDLIVSAPNATRGGLQESGAVYVIYGAESFPPELSISAPATFGVEILGARGLQYFGLNLAAVGDVDRDGLEDFVAGAPSPTAPGFQGELYLVYGSRDWPSSMAVDDASLRTFRLSETRPVVAQGNGHVDLNGRLGSAVIGLGDWNRDGYPDFAAGAPHQSLRFDPQVGAAYILYGGSQLPPSASDLEVGTAALPGEVFTGTGAWRRCGHGIGGGGDIDGDGSMDFLLQAAYDWGVRLLEPDPSTLYIVHGGRVGSGAWSACEVSPPQGSVLGGDRVVVRGSGFLGSEVVRFGGVDALSVEASSSAELLVEVPPAGADGPVDVELARGLENVTLRGAFRYHRRSPYPDVVLDEATLEGASPRALVIRELPGRTFDILVRQFAGTYFADLNGDGLDDLVIAARFDGEQAQGLVSIVFGSRDLPRTLEWSDIPTRGVLISGDTGQRSFGTTVAFPGDLDQDSFPDLAVGGARTLSPVEERVAYVIRGRSVWEPRLDIAQEVEAGRAVAIPRGTCGSPHVEIGGDLTGTGMPALLVGAASCEGANGSIDLHTQGIFPGQPLPLPAVITGDPVPRDGRPPSLGDLSPAGDLNGDGLLDLAAGSVGLFGEVFLLLGGDWSFREASVLDFLDQGRGVRIRHPLWGSELGERVVSAGDFDGDGFSDVLLGVSSGGDNYHGESYIVLGSPDLGEAVSELDLREEDRWRVRLDGEYSADYAGSVAGLGDLNGDGYSDVGIVTSSTLTPSSRAYVVLGEADPPERLHLGALGERGFTIRGIDGRWFSGGYGALAAGDMDGDGLKDLAIGEHTPGGKRVVVIFGGSGPAGEFVRGRVNRDEQIDLSDAVSILGYLFLGSAEPDCLDAADVNDSGGIDVSDAVYLLNHLFLGGMAPPEPHPESGPDPTADDLTC